MINKIVLRSFVFLFLLLIASCNQYKRVNVRPTEFVHDEKVQEKFEFYRVFVYDSTGKVFRLEAPQINSDTIKGNLVKLEDTLSKKSLEVEKESDVHFYLKKSIDSVDLKKEKVSIQAKDIEHVTAYAKNESKTMAIIGVILLAIVGVFVVAFGLLILLVFASGAAAEESSAGSNSNSDSNSGGNGSSEGGGSNSGCFIATMTYGSYEAPQVLVFREFRDRFLLKHGWGRSFVNWYYTYSPNFVAKYQENQWVRSFVKICLTPLQWCLSLKFRK